MRSLLSSKSRTSFQRPRISESRDRIVWIAYFDARLAAFENGRLILDFSDANKLATGHNYEEARMRHRHALQSAIFDVFGVEAVVIEQ